MKRFFKSLLCCASAVSTAFFCAIAFSACGKDDSSSPAEEISFTVEEKYVTRDGLNVYGKLYLPKDAEGKIPAVILSHSANLTADSMNLYAAGFADRGFAAYAFDFCGGSSSSRSDGKTEEMTLFTECDDLKAAIAAISALDYVDEERIYLFGTSQGGLVSALTAEDCADSVKGEILLYPAFNIPELVSSFSGMESGGFGSFGGGYGQAFSDTLKNYDVYSHIGSFGGKVLIIHGSADFIVNKSYSERAALLYTDCTLKILEGAGHGFNSENYSMSGDYDDQVWTFIDEYLAE